MGGAESIPEREGGDVHGRIVVHTIVIGRDEPGRMSTCKDARATTGPGASTHPPPRSHERMGTPRGTQKRIGTIDHRNSPIAASTRPREKDEPTSRRWQAIGARSVVPKWLALPSSTRVTKLNRSWSTLHPSHGRPQQMQPPILVSFFRAFLRTTPLGGILGQATPIAKLKQGGLDHVGNDNKPPPLPDGNAQGIG
eukprot:scaffold1671_cov344-Pavlova_lutheri.AAC.46